MGGQGSACRLYASIGTFGELLKAPRQRAQSTQRELSVAVGYSAAQWLMREVTMP
jgi:hypothetical protein